MLNKAYRYVMDPEVFRLRGSDADKATFGKMLKTLLQTKSGRSVITYIGDLVHAQQIKKPVTLKMQRPNKDVLGMAYGDLEVRLNRIAMQNMNAHQKQRAILMQTKTLLHELVHICQFLEGQERCAQQFSVPAHLYADIMMEMEATLKEQSFEIEAKKLWSNATKHMHFCEGKSGWRHKLVESFFASEPHYLVPVWIDSFIEDLEKPDKIILSDPNEKKVFAKWMDRYFQKMGLLFSYRNFPLRRSFGIKNHKDGVLTIKGDNGMLIVDRFGRPLVAGSGFEKKRDSALKFTIFARKEALSEAKKWVSQLKKEHPASHISVVRGMHEKIFSNPFFDKTIQKQSMYLGGR